MSTPADSPAIAAAIVNIEEYWGTMARTWPWMRQQSLRPVYVLAGEMLIALTRAFPMMLQSNQLRWYAREVQGTPSLYVLFPEQFQEEARKRVGNTDPRQLEGKNAITFLYLTSVNQQTEVAKTLLISTTQHAPMFRAQVAHELLNCAAATSWDGTQMRAGVRRVHWQTGSALQWGAMLNDLVIDTLLLDFLPNGSNYTRASLLNGQQGPYWRIAEALGTKIPPDVLQAALFGPPAELATLEGLLAEVCERGNAAQWIDQQLTARRWEELAQVVGAQMPEA